MREKNAQTIVEISFLIAIVAIVTIFAYAKMNNVTFNLANMTKIGITKHSPKAIEATKSRLESLLDSEGGDTASKIETAGAIGQLISAYKAGNVALKDYILASLKKYDSRIDPETCLNSPSTCTGLMNVSDYGFYNTSKYTPGEKIVATSEVKYTVNYIDDRGELKVKTISQSVAVPSSFLPENYISTFGEQGYNADHAIKSYLYDWFYIDEAIGSAIDTQAHVISNMQELYNSLTDAEKLLYPTIDFSKIAKQ